MENLFIMSYNFVPIEFTKSVVGPNKLEQLGSSEYLGVKIESSRNGKRNSINTFRLFCCRVFEDGRRLQTYSYEDVFSVTSKDITVPIDFAALTDAQHNFLSQAALDNKLIVFNFPAKVDCGGVTFNCHVQGNKNYFENLVTESHFHWLAEEFRSQDNFAVFNEFLNFRLQTVVYVEKVDINNPVFKNVVYKVGDRYVTSMYGILELVFFLYNASFDFVESITTKMSGRSGSFTGFCSTLDIRLLDRLLVYVGRCYEADISLNINQLIFTVETMFFIPFEHLLCDFYKHGLLLIDLNSPEHGNTYVISKKFRMGRYDCGPIIEAPRIHAANNHLVVFFDENLLSDSKSAFDHSLHVEYFRNDISKCAKEYFGVSSWKYVWHSDQGELPHVILTCEDKSNDPYYLNFAGVKYEMNGMRSLLAIEALSAVRMMLLANRNRVKKHYGTRSFNLKCLISQGVLQDSFCRCMVEIVLYVEYNLSIPRAIVLAFKRHLEVSSKPKYGCDYSVFWKLLSDNVHWFYRDPIFIKHITVGMYNPDIIGVQLISSRVKRMYDDKIYSDIMIPDYVFEYVCLPGISCDYFDQKVGKSYTFSPIVKVRNTKFKHPMFNYNYELFNKMVRNWFSHNGLDVSEESVVKDQNSIIKKQPAKISASKPKPKGMILSDFINVKKMIPKSRSNSSVSDSNVDSDVSSSEKELGSKSLEKHHNNNSNSHDNSDGSKDLILDGPAKSYEEDEDEDDISNSSSSRSADSYESSVEEEEAVVINDVMRSVKNKCYADALRESTNDRKVSGINIFST